MSKKSVALVGLDPFTIDFSNPEYTHFLKLGPGGVKAMLDKDRDALNALGFEAELVLVTADLDAPRADVTEALRSRKWDCVLIGNGVRSIPRNFLLFELLVNLVHEHAPQARICFNTKPDDSAESVRRWVDP